MPVPLASRERTSTTDSTEDRTITDDTYGINGRIRDATTGQGAAGVTVELWDEDIREDDYIATTTTDERGRFTVEFAAETFLEYEKDARPELYFKIFSDDELIENTKESTVVQIAPGEPRVGLELDIDLPRRPPKITETWVGDGDDAFMPEWPERAVPSVPERTRWFQERAGSKSGAASLSRLTAALDHAAAIPTPGRRRDDVVRDGRRQLLERNYPRAAEERPTVVVDEGGEMREVKVFDETASAGIGSFGPTVSVDALEGESALVALPLDPGEASDLDVDTAVLVRHSKTGSRIVDASAFSRRDNLLYARITEPGEYRALALPTHPWFRQTITSLREHWPLIRAEQKLDLETNVREEICQVILCRNELFDRGREGDLLEFGLGQPPELPDRLDFEGDICEFCIGGPGGGIIDGGRFDGGGVGDLPGELDLDRRDDEGCHEWTSIGPAPGSGFWGIGRVTQLAVHPTDRDTLLAGSAGGGVWKSTDAGVHWEPVMHSEPTLTIGGVAFAPSNPSVMYAASGEDADGFNPAWPGVGVYRSDDGGGDWDLLSNVQSTRFSAVEVHPTRPETVYVAGNQGLHKSTDGGETWITNPGDASLFDGQVTDVVVAHDEPDRVYMGVWNDGVYRSTTGGEQVGTSAAFTRLDGSTQLPNGGNAGWIKLGLGRAGTNGSDFLATKLGPNGSRIFTTTDAGTTWTEQASNVAAVGFDEWASVIAVDPKNEDRLFAGAAGAFKRSTDGGSTWTSVSGGIHPDQQDAVVAPDASTPDRVYLANDGGVYRSTDAGNSWSFASGDMATSQLYDIDISQRDPEVVACGAQDNGIYYRDTGGSWTHLSFGWDGTQTEVDPADPDIVYFSSQNGISNRASGGLARTTDGGTTISPLGTNGLSGTSPWVTILELEPTASISNPATNRTLFVCGSTRLFRSTDGGSNWQVVSDGAGTPFTTAGTITALEFAPGDPSILYLGTAGGALYHGTNGGATAGDWTRIDTPGGAADALFPNSRISSISVDPTDADRAWVTFAGDGVSYSARPDIVTNPLGISHVFKTPDGGTEWEDASGRFEPLNLPDVPTSAVAIDNLDSEVAWVGTDVGVFKTTDGGTTWMDFQTGLPRSPVTELRLQYSSRLLTAGTMGRGVYQRNVP